MPSRSQLRNRASMGTRMNEDRMAERLAELVALRVQRKLGKKANLRLVGRENLHREVPGAPKPEPRPARLMDDITRESRLRLIRELARVYRDCGFNVIIKQATIGKSGLDALSDEEVIQLHRDLDRARECIRDGIDFEEAGLIKPMG